jgi:Outer membrane lipoprotein carrier protein LolA
MATKRSGLAALLATVALASTAPPACAAAELDPWQLLETLRTALAADGPLLADFRQSYVPAGFPSGDTESGSVALSLPDCLRWDYRDPYAKSFLVCGARAWIWVEGEPRGQKVTIEADREMGLDLLLLPSGQLSSRYRASASRAPSGELELVLEPLSRDSQLVVANLTLDAPGRRLLALEWRDREGNVSSFRFTAWHVPAEPTVFAPPRLEWSEPGTGD